jgi:L-aspartate oxidase
VLRTRYDLVIVGSGIAGLYATLLAAPHGRVLVVTKGSLEESNTRYAQGGIAVALGQKDSPELHLRDTISAGDGLCDPHSVSILTKDAPDAILDLVRLGVPFDRDGNELASTREAAHSRPRVLHAGGDATGASIERTLAAAVRSAGVTVLENAVCTRLLGDARHVSGVELLLGSGSVAAVSASSVILATGGAGQLFARTTNPEVATGDGLAVAFRAGAELADLEFFQFHPTALHLPGAPSFLISEAVRGEGGILRDDSGRAFMEDYHPDRELAPRDVVARAIHSQMSTTGSDHVWLDVTHLPSETIERRFPTIVRFCRGNGIDPVREPVPVAPAAHYLMGGIMTDVFGRTNLAGLFACGEVACTGAHGANRLASNSLLEGLVFARRAVKCLVEGVKNPPGEPAGERIGDIAIDCGAAMASEGSRLALGEIMWRHASLVRSEASLVDARSAVRGFSTASSAPSRERQETANLALLAELVIASALIRTESRGAHFRSDFPSRDAAWLRHIVISKQGARLTQLNDYGQLGLQPDLAGFMR